MSDDSKYKKLFDEALGNVRSDRKKTNLASNILISQIKKNQNLSHDRDIAMSLSKYMESLTRSNEQLLKLLQIEQKNNPLDEDINEDDIKKAYDDIQGS